MGDAALYGEIVLGADVDGFEAFIGFWSPLDYKKQWLQGLRRLVHERRVSCLITSLDDPLEGIVRWWLCYPDGERVRFREAFFLPGDERGAFSTSDPYASIPPRSERGEDGHEISEWDVPLSEVAEFLAASEA